MRFPRVLDAVKQFPPPSYRAYEEQIDDIETSNDADDASTENRVDIPNHEPGTQALKKDPAPKRDHAVKAECAPGEEQQEPKRCIPDLPQEATDQGDLNKKCGDPPIFRNSPTRDAFKSKHAGAQTSMLITDQDDPGRHGTTGAQHSQETAPRNLIQLMDLARKQKENQVLMRRQMEAQQIENDRRYEEWTSKHEAEKKKAQDEAKAKTDAASAQIVQLKLELRQYQEDQKKVYEENEELKKQRSEMEQKLQMARQYSREKRQSDLMELEYDRQSLNEAWRKVRAKEKRLLMDKHRIRFQLQKMMRLMHKANLQMGIQHEHLRIQNEKMCQLMLELDQLRNSGVSRSRAVMTGGLVEGLPTPGDEIDDDSRRMVEIVESAEELMAACSGQESLSTPSQCSEALSDLDIDYSLLAELALYETGNSPSPSSTFHTTSVTSPIISSQVSPPTNETRALPEHSTAAPTSLPTMNHRNSLDSIKGTCSGQWKPAVSSNVPSPPHISRRHSFPALGGWSSSGTATPTPAARALATPLPRYSSMSRTKAGRPRVLAEFARSGAPWMARSASPTNPASRIDPVRYLDELDLSQVPISPTSYSPLFVPGYSGYTDWQAAGSPTIPPASPISPFPLPRVFQPPPRNPLPPLLRDGREEMRKRWLEKKWARAKQEKEEAQKLAQLERERKRQAIDAMLDELPCMKRARITDEEIDLMAGRSPQASNRSQHPGVVKQEPSVEDVSTVPAAKNDDPPTRKVNSKPHENVRSHSSPSKHQHLRSTVSAANLQVARRVARCRERRRARLGVAPATPRRKRIRRRPWVPKMPGSWPRSPPPSPSPEPTINTAMADQVGVRARLGGVIRFLRARPRGVAYAIAGAIYAWNIWQLWVVERDVFAANEVPPSIVDRIRNEAPQIDWFSKIRYDLLKGEARTMMG